jgi:NADH-quinone oxidoreductase subunit K
MKGRSLLDLGALAAVFAAVFYALSRETLIEGALVTSALLFALGFVGVIIRRNVLIVLMCVELMLNAVNIALIAFSRARGDVHGHGLTFFVIALAAAEAAVGLAIVVAVFRSRKTVNIDEVSLMKH